MKDTIEVINRMKADGVISEYAIGGAVGATFYLEPAATLDIDIFVEFGHDAGSSLVSLAPIYDYLKRRGSIVKGEHIVIEDWPVQFLVPANSLEREALAEAIETTLDGVHTRVIGAEYLVAIALQTGRAKDHIRILQFLELAKLDSIKLKALLEKHGLTTKWSKFEKKYLGD